MIFVVGPTASGKTEVGRIFASKKFIIFDLGPMLRSIYQRTNYDGEFLEWVKHGEEREGIHFTDALLLGEILHAISSENIDVHQDIIIVGNRSLGGIEYLRYGISSQRTSHIIFMETRPDIRYKRFNQREGTTLSMRDFDSLLDLEFERKMGLYDIKIVADTIIQNNGNKDELQEEIRGLFQLLDYQWTPDQGN